MTVCADLVGKVFSRLTVLSREPKNNKQGKAVWLCQCECGNTCTAITCNLTGGLTRSCGCLREESIRKPKKENPIGRTKAYNIWRKIKIRCSNPKHRSYVRYGGRGIKVEEPWLSDSELFCSWYKNESLKFPEEIREILQIDRIDVNGNYSANNCRLVTPEDNSNNRRDNKMFTYMGESGTVAQLVTKYGVVPRPTVYKRLESGWDIHKALTTPRKV